jgi:hypothetical protein
MLPRSVIVMQSASSFGVSAPQWFYTISRNVCIDKVLSKHTFKAKTMIKFPKDGRSSQEKGIL